MGGSRGFRSYKTIGAIEYPNRINRDLLIQLTLDRRISALESIAPELHPPDIPFAIYAHVQSHRLLVCYMDAPGDTRFLLPQPAILLCRANIKLEPWFSSARRIWTCRTTAIDRGDRMRVQEALLTQRDGISLKELAKLIRATSAPAFDVIFAMVAEGTAVVSPGTATSPQMPLFPPPNTQADGLDIGSLASRAVDYHRQILASLSDLTRSNGDGHENSARQNEPLGTRVSPP